MVSIGLLLYEGFFMCGSNLSAHIFHVGNFKNLNPKIRSKTFVTKATSVKILWGFQKLWCLFMLRDCQQITFVMLNGLCLLRTPPPSHTPPHLPLISLPIGTNGKSLAVIGKFPSVEEITNAMIGNDELSNYSW